MKSNRNFLNLKLFIKTVPIIMIAFTVIIIFNINATGKTNLGANKPPVSQKYQQNMKNFQFMIADMVEKVIPAVVSIHTKTAIPERNNINTFEYFFGIKPNHQNRNRPKPERQGLGSGVIISNDGYILTNNHVIADADEITVTLADNQEFSAEIIGRDEKSDIAVIKLKNSPKNLPVAYLGDSDALRVGEWLVAIGSPYGLNKTVTTGIVSAKGVHNRGITSYENFIQTDAAINPGNSGGGLFTVNGELIGINTAILSRSGGFQGIGFAVPINMIKNIIDDLIDKGKVSRGWLGVSIQELTPDIAKALGLKKSRGALINEVFEDTPADKYGLKSGDVVLKIDGKTIKDANNLRHKVAMIKPNSNVEFEILRDFKHKTLDITIGSQDKSEELVLESPKGEKTILGIVSKTLNKEQKNNLQVDNGVIIEKIIAKSPADKANLKAGDVILYANKKSVTSNSVLKTIINDSDGVLLLLVLRDNHKFYTIVRLN